MTPRGLLSAPLRLLIISAALAAALAGCKDKQEAPPPPPKPAAIVKPKPAPSLTKEQAMAALLALPEVKAWSSDIEQRSRGKSHGAIIEDNPTPRTLNGKQYWQMSFVENRKQSVQRRESFLVAQTDGQILVEDLQNDTVLSLDEWRRGIRRVQLKSAD
ncbi:hypothetical protein [Massilia niabensis]|uniref:Lipoprotein n=1 Tax=Massilia niabensis TaxID=544910 RepID=A0ABW0L9A1_9BURK